MNSKTAKAADKALLRLEKEFDRFIVAIADIRADIKADIKKHYGTPKKKGT